VVIEAGGDRRGFGLGCKRDLRARTGACKLSRSGSIDSRSLLKIRSARSAAPSSRGGLTRWTSTAAV
jgi:hypothetical protein